MAKADYEKMACDALGLKHPTDIKQGEIYHNIGHFEIGSNVESVRQITNKRLNSIKQVLDTARSKAEEESGASISSEEFEKQWCKLGYLSYSQYIETVKNIKSLRKELYSNNSANPHQHFIKLIEIYDADTYTDDLTGYKNYLSIYAKKTHGLLSQKVPAFIPEKERKMHTWAIGSSGSGKSTLLKTLINEDIKNGQCGVVIIDPHGELATEISHWKEFAKNDRLALIDPNLSPEYSPCINPLTLPNGSEVDQYSQELGTVFEDMLIGKNQGMTDNMKSILQYTLWVLVKDGKANMLDLLDFLSEDENGRWTRKGKSASNMLVSRFFQKFHNQRYKPTKDAVAAKIEAILSREAAQKIFLGKSTFDLEKLLNNRKVVVFNLSKGRIGSDAAEAVGRFVIGRLHGMALRRASEERLTRTPIHVYVDECQNFIGGQINDILAEDRKYGLHLTLANQYRTQIARREVSEALVKTAHVSLFGLTQYDPVINRKIGLTAGEMQDLEQGKFYYRAGNSNAVKIHVRSDFADNRNDMPQRAWQKIVTHQLENYYSPLIPLDDALNDLPELPID